ncbi:hypothetical protein BCR44DRAFT_1424249 [Catenaria anguillulae PL171]|uniref:Tyrosinase copper-binding domain-containing protein n=1 Tax=Catenaria anguillulae PL171 TaxID=765915 RepID=A0A1Y2I2E8_9FUNG|nr:hypothetical protein BCR44DRAFT_1424249 [Catenaria anguillulae PL171]
MVPAASLTPLMRLLLAALALAATTALAAPQSSSATAPRQSSSPTTSSSAAPAFTLPNTLTDAGPRANGFTVWHSAPVPASWPVIFSAAPPNLDLSNRNNPSIDSEPFVFTWTFSPQPNTPPQPAACTIAGMPFVSPCVGRVVEFTFAGAGDFTAQCIVTRGNERVGVLTVPITIQRPGSGADRQRATRREFRDLHPADWSRFVSAAMGLKALRIWDHMSLTHAMTFLNTSGGMPGASPRTSAHSSPAFLTWHRVYVRIFERLFEKILGDESFGLPFQLSTDHPNLAWLRSFRPSAASPYPLFTDKYVGPSGDLARGSAVPSGPFCSTNSGSSACTSKWEYPQRLGLGTTFVQRALGNATNVRLPTAEQVALMMDLTEYDVAPFDSAKFVGAFAMGGGPFGGMHNDVHRWIGGTMLNVRYSILDPVFLLHHNNVERLFYLWQKQHSCQVASCWRPRTSDLNGMADLPGVVATRSGLRLRGHMIDDEMHPWRIRHQDVWGADGVSDYVYADPKVAGPPPGNLADPATRGAGGSDKNSTRSGSTVFDRPSAAMTRWSVGMAGVLATAVSLMASVV